MRHEVYTDEEKAVVKRMQGIDSDGHWLCKPCYRVVTDPVQGPQLMKGTLQINLNASGVGNAEAVAQKFHDNLIALTNKNKLS